MNPSYEILVTEDESHTVRWIEGDVTFHSRHGAIQESQHVFIKYGLDALVKNGLNGITVFEMGFGTGLNALLAWKVAQQEKIHIDYQTIEQHFLPESIWGGLNHAAKLQIAPHLVSFMHSAPSNQSVNVDHHFSLKKYEEDIEHFTHSTSYDIIFYDAFGPGCHPEHWESKILSTLFATLRPGGFLITFCAQGAFKRSLKEVGFKVEPLPGPPGKREMTRAWKVI